MKTKLIRKRKPQQTRADQFQEESLIPDPRGQLTPAQMVDMKLGSMTDSCPVLASQLQGAVKLRPR